LIPDLMEINAAGTGPACPNGKEGFFMQAGSRDKRDGDQAVQDWGGNSDNSRRRNRHPRREEKSIVYKEPEEKMPEEISIEGNLK